MMTSKEAHPCRRCSAAEAPLRLRNDWTCSNCYVDYVETKIGSRLGALARETRTVSASPASRRYLAGLSFGPSSSALTYLLDGSAKYYSSKSSTPAFESLIIHVDTTLQSSQKKSHTRDSQQLLREYCRRFPNVSFECVHLSKVFSLQSIAWSSLPLFEFGGTGNEEDASQRLLRLLESMPSPTSRADLLRTLIRHLLLGLALERSCTALLLGHSKTALASLALTEVVNGRGLGVPWLINDGPFAMPALVHAPEFSRHNTEMLVYYPLRGITRDEVTTYTALVPLLLQTVEPEENRVARSVVSHRDLSLEEVVVRFLDDVQLSQPNIVANVVRTAEKLSRVTGKGYCQLCAMAIDELGDLCWAGRVGDDEGRLRGGAEICHGCRRSLSG